MRLVIKRQTLIAWIALIAITALPLTITAQTQIKYHSNRFSVQDDVKLGRQAAQEAEQQFPLLRDEEVRGYVESVGRRLVSAIPPQFQHPEFQYYFKVVNARDINAFALPGGPMYVNRGMIEAAKTEGEMAGVMAHELSHVALRHGTAQATKGQKYGTLAAIAGIAGTIATGNAGVGQLAQAPFAVYLLKFSREYETEADVLGSQIMARAGYDPRDLANMFRTLEQQGGGGGGFLSDHPSPSDRYARIDREAQMLRVNGGGGDSRQFARIQERLRGYQQAPTMAEIQRSGQRYPVGENTGYPDRMPTGRVEYPSSRYQSYSIFGNGVQVSVPANWRQLNEASSVWFVPEGGYGQANGQAVFTHGVNFGVAQTNSRNLQQATNELINSLARGNSSLRTSGGYQRTTLDGRTALWSTLSNVNEATGRPENVRLITTQLRNGQLFYMVAVAPQNERNFETAFQNVMRSVRIND
ncbi:MAG TPA: M48 family metalloprotease [Pyrinomonadaceae bacterium]